MLASLGRQSTRKASLEHAIVVACDMYDEARYRQRLSLAHRTHTYAQIAALTLGELRKQIDASNGKTAYHTYVSCIEKYFVPYFAERRVECRARFRPPKSFKKLNGENRLVVFNETDMVGVNFNCSKS